MFFALLFGLGCIKQTQSITALDIGGNHKECTYVTISKVRSYQGIILRETKKLPIDESLFYCCPNSKGQPICKKAVWDYIDEIILDIENDSTSYERSDLDF